MEVEKHIPFSRQELKKFPFAVVAYIFKIQLAQETVAERKDLVLLGDVVNAPNSSRPAALPAMPRFPPWLSSEEQVEEVVVAVMISPISEGALYS